ncbi:EGF-like domain-containing protein 2 isoform X2 [Mytilus californianus]|uniref:EGF-like domain-containing protein 2 isoform X2 n=1 Tax=Mytilus californianus TaxID=6549 RepID=UPI00224636EB|nr:EGF-like domain-containing protein 2 isoform X2 [Mytilus californianus]
MNILTKLTVFLLMCSVTAKYNCKMDGCQNGGNCTYFGNCECTHGFVGYDCGVQMALRSFGPSCSIKCMNGGTCYNTNMCYCTESFHGNRCQYQKENVQCGLEGIQITIMTSTKFQGEITTKPNSTGCQFRSFLTSNSTSLRSFRLITPLSLQTTNPCHRAINRTVTPDKVTYSIDVAVSEKEGVYNPLRDRIVNFKCVYPRRIGEGTTQDNTQSYTPVELLYLNTRLQPLTQGVQEGDVFFIDFTPTTESGNIFEPESYCNYQRSNGLQVMSMEAFSVHNGKVTTFKMIEKGCILPTAESRVKSMNVVEGKRPNGDRIFKTRIEMTAFSLYGNSYLHFNYDLKFCPEACPEIRCVKRQRVQPTQHHQQNFHFGGPGLNIVI